MVYLHLTFVSIRVILRTMQDLKQSQQVNTRELLSHLSKNALLHLILSTEVKKMQYGQLTVNVMLKNGIADISTLNIVTNKRIRY